jgi:hypothetical protein
MSLYNMIAGTNPLAGGLLHALAIDPSSVARLRDCALVEYAGDLAIRVLTRTGGNNRDDYEDSIAALQAHAMYIEDRDDDFDSTYAEFFFRVPDATKLELHAACAKAGKSINDLVDSTSLHDKFEAAIAAIKATAP